MKTGNKGTAGEYIALNGGLYMMVSRTSSLKKDKTGKLSRFENILKIID